MLPAPPAHQYSYCEPWSRGSASAKFPSHSARCQQDQSILCCINEIINPSGKRQCHPPLQAVGVGDLSSLRHSLTTLVHTAGYPSPEWQMPHRGDSRCVALVYDLIYTYVFRLLCAAPLYTSHPAGICHFRRAQMNRNAHRGSCAV